jgi:hypothetical protein
VTMSCVFGTPRVTVCAVSVVQSCDVTVTAAVLLVAMRRRRGSQALSGPVKQVSVPVGEATEARGTPSFRKWTR